MKKKYNPLLSIGMAIVALTIIIDNLIAKLPDALAILLMVIGLGLMVIAIIKMTRKKTKQENPEDERDPRE